VEEDYHTRDPSGNPDLNQRWSVYRVISRYSWDVLQELAACQPGGGIEHLEHGLYLLRKPPCPCDAKKRPTPCKAGQINNPLRPRRLR
jgi:hypothetical protein